ncbi:hypothetical protein BDC45DRAFT_530267 [Circinella umbellata]|nr:hypothetical protein BDC45DRAFT_530267 [Circinella umbellata]
MTISTYLESDQQYLLWGLMEKIHNTTDIGPLEKKNPPMQVLQQTTTKKKLSGVDNITRKAMSRKMNTVFVGGSIELGCMEICGRTPDQTKELQDSYHKTSHIMKDMLMDIVNKTPHLIHYVGVTGYCINGEKVCMIDVDCADGFVIRVRPIVIVSKIDTW